MYSKIRTERVFKGNTGELLRDIKENNARRNDGRYEVSFSWIPGAELSSTNEALSRKHLQNDERRLSTNENLRQEYADIIEEQLRVSIVQEAPERPTGERVFYMPHKPAIKERVQ